MNQNYPLRKRRSIFLFLFTLLIGNIAYAQTASTANYVFTTNTTGSLIDMSTGATNFTSLANQDDAASAVTSIGFDFWYMGTRYTQFSVNTNGALRLGGTAVAGARRGNDFPVASEALIAAWLGDMHTRTLGKVQYKLLGSAPNRILVIEWSNMALDYSSTSADANIQCLLYETTGAIEFRYGSMTVAAAQATATYRKVAVGFSSNTGNNNFVSVDPSTMLTNTTGTPVVTDYAVTGPVTAFTSAADGSRRDINFTPFVPTAVPTGLSFSPVTASTITLNWTEAVPATGVVKYAIYSSTDGINYNYVNAVSAGTNTLAVTSLVPNTTYYWKVYAVSEGALSATSLDGIQATAAAATYYFVGVGSADMGTAANWNTAADGSGSPRTTADGTDVLIVDGAGTTPGASATITLSAATSIGVLRITNNTALTMQSSSTTTRTLTITGGAGDDLDITSGSSLTMNSASNASAIAFSGTNNTGNIAGTVTLGGSTSNTINTTGGTGTVVTVTGTVNLTAASSTAVFTGNTSSLIFANGSNLNVSGYTTTNAFIPTATWGASSNITLTGGTTGTGISTSSTSFGNFTINSTTLTATLSAFTTGTITIQGNLNVMATNTGKFRATTSGSLTVNGNLNVSGGIFEAGSTTGTVTVNGAVNLSGGTLDVTSGTSTATLKVGGTFNQTGGTLNVSGTSSTNTLEFNGTTAQNVTIGTMGAGTLNVKINNAAGINLSGTLNINGNGSLTVTNGNVTGSGTIVYSSTGKLIYNGTAAQTATAVEFPSASGPASLTINNTAASPSVVIPFNRSLGSSGVLALTSGILDNSGYLLSITNTATGGITGGSATSYVKGALSRTLPASLASGSTYLFPIGKSGYNQAELINPVTNAGGTVTIQAEVIDAATGGTTGTNIGALNTNRYWAISATAGSGNFTSADMKLYDSPGTADAIAGSASLTGAYDLIGGINPTVTASSIATATPGLSAVLGYYVMATRSAPVLSNLAISPTGNQCTNVQRTVSVTVTPGAGAISTVVLNYSVNGVAQPAINMTNTSGNDWSGTIPTVTPANAAVLWYVTATDVNGLAKSQNGTGYTDEPLYGITASATASATPICAGMPTNITALIPLSGASSSIGNGTSLTSATSDVTAFGNRWPSFRMQLLFTAAELSASGLAAGPISAMTFNISTLGDGATNANYTVLMGTTTSSALTGYESTTGYTTVFPAATYTHAVGFNTINFSTPFVWNGTSNVVIDITYSGADITNNAQTYYTTTTVNTVAAAHSGGAAALFTTRPNVIFQGYILQPAATVSWSDGSNTIGSTNPLTVTPASNTTYTANITQYGCPITASVPVTVNPLPSAPSAVNSTQCGTGIPVASVASTAGVDGSGTFLWYDAPTGGNLVQGTAYGSLSNYYTNDFSSATLTNASVSGAAAIGSGVLTLQTAVTSAQGGFTVNASGYNSNQYQLNFDLSLTATGTSMADGFSYSFGDDALATTTTPAAEHGSGSKLRIGFFTYNAANGSDGKGIYLMYNVSATTGYTASTSGVLQYSTDVSWIPTSATTVTSACNISINSAGQLTLTVGGTPIFSNVQLPAAFITADKSTWKHVFSSRSGGVAGGFAMDNLVIQANAPVPGYTTYQSPVTSTTTFYVSEKGVNGCESPRTAVTATVTTPVANNTISTDQTICSGSAPAMLTGSTPTGGDGTNYTFQWQSSTTSAVTGFTDVASAGTGNDYTPGALTANTWYRRYVMSGVCDADTSAAIMITVMPAIANNTISGSQLFCAGSAAAIITGSTPTGGDGTYTYGWQSSTSGSTSGYASAGGTNNSIDYDPGIVSVNTWYRRYVVSGSCSDTSAPVAVQVTNPVTGNTISGTQTICSGGTPTMLTGTITGMYQDFTGLTSTSGISATALNPYNWTRSLNMGNLLTGSNINSYGRSGGNGALRANTYNVNSPNMARVESSSFGPSISGDSLRFDIASANYEDGFGPYGFVDTLRIYVDNGSGYVLLKQYLNNSLVVDTAGDGIVTANAGGTAFVPTATQWTTKKLALPVATTSVRFEFASGFANQIYVDRIQVDSAAFLWMSSTTSSTSGFTAASGTNTNVNYTPGALTQTTWYKRVAALGLCTPDSSNVIAITVNPTIANNTVSSAQNICSGSMAATLLGSTPTGGDGTYAYGWESSTTGATSGFTAATGTNNAMDYTPGSLSVNTWFRRYVVSGGCSDTSAAIAITINPVIANNTVSTAQTICSGSTPAMLTGSTPTGGDGTYAYGWESSTTGATSGFTAATGTNNAMDYTPGSLSANTWFRRYVVSGGCSDTSAAIAITINPVIANNTVSTAQTICSGSTPAMLTGSTPTGGDGTYAYAWESSTTGATSGFAAASGTNNAIDYAPGTLTATTWYRRYIVSGSCSDTSAAIAITVNPGIANNTVSTSQTVCTGTAPAPLTGSTPTGGDGTYTYGWESSTTSATAGFASASGTNNTINYTPGTISVNTWYRRYVMSGGCSDTSAAVAMTVTQPASISVQPATTVTLCSGNTIILNVTAVNAAGYTWYKGASPLSNTGNISGANSSELRIANATPSDAGTYSVVVSSANAPCGDVTSNNSTVTVNTMGTTLAANGASDTYTQVDGITNTYTDGSCNPIAMVQDASGGNTLGSVTAVVTVDGSVQTAGGQPYLQRHYQITPANNGAATVTLYATQAEFDAFNLAAGTYPLMPTGGVDNGNVRVSKFTGATPVTGTGVLITPTVAWNATYSWWEITFPVSSFSSFYIHTGIVGPLDVDIRDISAVNVGKRNRIDWTTSTETNIGKYDVERSLDGRNFSYIGNVQAKGQASVYSYWDENPAAGLNYYRLKVYDISGTATYSKVVTAYVNEEGAFMVTAHPNPVLDKLNVQLHGNAGANGMIHITDMSGKLIQVIKVNSTEIAIDMNNYAQGIYFIKYSDDIHTQTLKVNRQ